MYETDRVWMEYLPLHNTIYIPYLNVANNRYEWYFEWFKIQITMNVIQINSY